MASIRCYDSSKVIVTLIIINFRLYLTQLWCHVVGGTDPEKPFRTTVSRKHYFSPLLPLFFVTLPTVSPKKCFNAIKGYFSSLPLLFFFGNDRSQRVAFTSWLYNTEPTHGKHGFYLFIVQCGECLFYTRTDQKKETDSHIYLPRNTFRGVLLV